ncbi:MAG: hypothetical protein IT581_19055 [Verrucomicrobiales bacterium]|nr:hypothetical protein [Verrucomicrobiales bacterium]
MSTNPHSTRRPSRRFILLEGMVFGIVGGLLVAAGFYWLHASGGYLGLHLFGFALGGGLLLTGIQRLIRQRR